MKYLQSIRGLPRFITRPIACVSIPAIFLSLLSATVLVSSGCIELQAILSGTWPGTGGGDGNPDDNDNGGNGGSNGGPTDVPRVTLTVSNPVPMVNETVIFNCNLLSGADDQVRFAFQPSFARLIVDEQAGSAMLIIDASDIGASLTFTCTATNSTGTSPHSNTVTVIASESPIGP